MNYGHLSGVTYHLLSRQEIRIEFLLSWHGHWAHLRHLSDAIRDGYLGKRTLSFFASPEMVTANLRGERRPILPKRAVGKGTSDLLWGSHIDGTFPQMRFECICKMAHVLWAVGPIFFPFYVPEKWALKKGFKNRRVSDLFLSSFFGNNISAGKEGSNLNYEAYGQKRFVSAHI